MSDKYKCPCCGALTLDEERAWDICELCWWEDEPLQFDKPDYSGGANKLSLNDSKKEFFDNIYEFIKQEFYCPLLERKVGLDICNEISDVIQDIRKKEFVHVLDEFSEEYCKYICKSCPIYKAM